MLSSRLFARFRRAPLLATRLTQAPKPYQFISLRYNNTHRTFKKKPEQPRFDLNDMGISDGIKKELIPALLYLQKPNAFLSGVRAPKGIIFSGPPGTGKSMIAEALAGHAGVSFMMISAAEMIGEFIGEGERLLREAFDIASKNAPCVICLDEIDSIKKFPNARSGGELHANTQFNQLLTLLSQENPGVFVAGTTNYYRSIDPALVRAGRFDKHIIIPLPDQKQREAIISIHAKQKKIDETISFKDLSLNCPGFSGAKIAAWLNEAAILAQQDNSPITYSHLDEARMVAILGARNTQQRSEAQTLRIATHEAGHALVGHLLGKTVYKVTTLQYGNLGGYTEFLMDENSISTVKENLSADICTTLAGLSAESYYGREGLGSENDIKQAKEIANEIVDAGLGSSMLGFTREIDIENILQKERERAINLIKNDLQKMDSLINNLVRYEELNRYEFLEVINKNGLSSQSFLARKSTHRTFNCTLPESKKALMVTASLIENALGFRSGAVIDVTVTSNGDLRIKLLDEHLYCRIRDRLEAKNITIVSINTSEKTITISSHMIPKLRELYAARVTEENKLRFK